MYLGHAQESKKKYKEAISSFDKALHLSEKFHEEHFIRAYSMQGMGTALMHSTNTLDLDRSILFLKKSLVEYKKCDFEGVQEYKESCLTTLVFVFLLRGKIENAERRIKKILEGEKLSIRELHELLLNLAHSFFKRKQYRKSLQYYEKALLFSPKNNFLKGENLCFLGRSLYHIAEFSKAIKPLKESLPLIKSDKALCVSTQDYLKKALSAI